MRGLENAAALTNTAGLSYATPPRSQTAPCYTGDEELSWISPERCVTFVQKHGLMQTIAGFPSNLFALMKIQLKNMRICVCFHQRCKANQNGHQPNKVTCSDQWLYIRDGSRFSNILFNYRISIRLCDYFLKVYQGLTIKTVRWRERHSDLSLARSGHCRWSLNFIICMRF